MLKIIFLINLIFLVFITNAQLNDSISNTVSIDSVIVFGTKKSTFHFQDKELIAIDVSKKNATITLEKILESNAKISIKRYGEGQIATISVKGFNASHTDVLWNDIRLNSPTLGQADLSLITTGNNTNIFFTETNADNIAGAISVQNRMNFKQRKKFTLFSSLSSIANFSQGISYEFSKNNNFYSNSNFSFSYNVNRYKYVNKSLPNSAETYLKNGNTKAIHFEQINAFKLKKENQLHFFIKTFLSDRNIAPTIYEFSSTKNQKDNLFLAKIKWLKKNKNYNISLSTAIIFQSLHFKLSTNSQEIVNHSKSIQTSFNYLLKKGENFRFLLKINNDIQNGNSNNFQQAIWQNKLMISPFIRYQINKELNAVFSISELVLNTKFSQPLPSITIKYSPKNQPANILLQADYSRKVKFPTINDLHWNPGGNINLKEEYAHSLSASLFIDKKMRKFNFSNKFEWFNVFSENYIQWQPSNNGYWKPKNIGNVYSRGFTNTFKISYYINRKTKISNYFSFNYTKTSLQNKPEQLIYVPINNWNNSTKIETKWINFIINQQFVSEKYTNYKNTLKLNEYYLLDLIVSKKFRLKNNQKLQLSIEANNIFNTTFYTYINRALPKRHYYFKIKYTFVK